MVHRKLHHGTQSLHNIQKPHNINLKLTFLKVQTKQLAMCSLRTLQNIQAIWTSTTLHYPKGSEPSLDPKLTYSTHIHNISVHAHKPLQIIKAFTATGWGKQKETLMATYNAPMRPALEYASTMVVSWIFNQHQHIARMYTRHKHTTSATIIHALISCQLAIVIPFCTHREHITPVLKQLRWLKIQDRIIYKMLMLTYKSYYNMAPPYLCELINKKESHVNTRLGTDHHQLIVPPISKDCSNTFLERSFIYAAPCEWNKLSEHIRISNFDCFRKSVKTMLFTQQYGC